MPPVAEPRGYAAEAAVTQLRSGGVSSAGVSHAVLRIADPRPGLRWLDIGCGTGALLRAVRDTQQPASLQAVDVHPWLDTDLRDDVDLHVGPAEQALAEVSTADRVTLVEVLEHLEAPWTTLRRAAGLVAPGGVLVLSAPNIASLRSRMELPLRGRLTAFRPDHPPHLTPILSHVCRQVLEDCGLVVGAVEYAQSDVIPLMGGRPWPVGVASRAPGLLCNSMVVSGRRWH
ncbi:MAG: class I SAM-dependent methyltransferase [Solirubrobacteraceae bacterium]